MLSVLRTLAAVACVWAMGAAAWAQDAPAGAPQDAGPSAPLGAGAVRAALFGYDLLGEVMGTGEAWSECIDPRGHTWWRIGDFADEGRLQVRDDGQACFRYRHTDFREEACWTMRVDNGRLRFDLVNGVSLPLVVVSRRPVASCGPDAPVA
jgi:hypothetical protein